MNTAYVLNKFQSNPYEGVMVDTTSKGGVWAGLSPFNLNAMKYGAYLFENLWQYSKVYKDQVDSLGNPTTVWWSWRNAGFNLQKPMRYPRGKGARPLYSFWFGFKLDYIPARKKIYVPIYAELVQKTDSYKKLKELFNEESVILRDYDGYDYTDMGLSLNQVLNDPRRKCGHAFVLAALLTNRLDSMLDSDL